MTETFRPKVSFFAFDFAVARAGLAGLAGWAGGVAGLAGWLGGWAAGLAGLAAGLPAGLARLGHCIGFGSGVLSESFDRNVLTETFRFLLLISQLRGPVWNCIRFGSGVLEVLPGFSGFLLFAFAV